MYFTFKKNNKQTKKPGNGFLQNGASAWMRSLQTSIEIKFLPKFMERTSIILKTLLVKTPIAPPTLLIPNRELKQTDAAGERRRSPSNFHSIKE